MAELADVLDLGSSAPGVQVRPLLSAPSDQYSNLLERFGCWSFFCGGLSSSLIIDIIML